MDAPTWLTSAWGAVSPYAAKLAVWRGYEQDLQTLLIYGAGIAAFTMLVFAFFCNNLSRREAFLSKGGKGAKARTLRGLEFAFVFPAVSFLFFGVLASSLFLLAKSQSTYQILLLSMSVVVGVRATAFVSELAAADLAKLLPLSLLAVLIVDPSYASLDKTWAHFAAVPGLLPLIARFFLLFIVMEAVLRAGRHALLRLTTRAKTKRVSKASLIDNARSVPVRGGAPEMTRER